MARQQKRRRRGGAKLAAARSALARLGAVPASTMPLRGDTDALERLAAVHFCSHERGEENEQGPLRIQRRGYAAPMPDDIDADTIRRAEAEVAAWWRLQVRSREIALLGELIKNSRRRCAP